MSKNKFGLLKQKIRTWLKSTADKTDSFKKEESGAVIIIVACCLVVFLSAVSFATDLGLVYYQESKLQSALDSAALAAAECMPNTVKARTAAVEYIEKNGFTMENVVIEFPSDEIVRIEQTDFEIQTVFANFFNINKVNVNAKAAAKFVDKKMSLDFDYLMFHGDTSKFQLGGRYNVNGSIFGNGAVDVNGGSGSSISGMAGGHGYVTHNQWSVTVGQTESYLPKQDMPDYDEMIMAIAPTFNMSVFDMNITHISSSNYYTNRTSGNRNFAQGSYSSTYVGGNATTVYNANLVFFTNLCIGGDFDCSANTTIYGDLYVGGKLTLQWGKTLTVHGDVYIEDDFDVQGPLYLGDSLYVGGSLTRGSTYGMWIDGLTYIGENMSLQGNATFRNGVYVRGNFTKGGSIALNIRGVTCVGGAIDWSNGGNEINGSIYANGTGVPLWNKNVVNLSGPLTLNGDIYCGDGNGTHPGSVINLSGNGGYHMDGILYSKGSVTASQGANGVWLNGCIIAEDDISIGGTTHTYNEELATVSLYARNGDITLSSAAGGFDLWGIIYAPHGNVALNSGGFDIFGNIIGDTITCNPGGLNLGENTRTLPFMKAVRCAALIE